MAFTHIPRIPDLGSSGHGSGDRTWPTLSVVELDVVDLLLAGMGNPEIGSRLGIGEATVEHHVGQVLVKLGVGSRTAFVGIAGGDAARAARLVPATGEERGR